MRLCQYHDLFGLPRQGAHAIRLFDFAVVDVVLTFLGAYLIQWSLNNWQIRDRNWSYWEVLLGFTVLGIFLHWLFCVPTKLNQLLGL